MKTTAYIFCIFLCIFQAKSQNIEEIKNQKPLTISGSIDARFIAYSANGIAARRQPFAWIISGNPTLSLYGISIPLNFSLSDQDRSFSQPFSQFGLSPTYKWITVHAGYRNLSFSPYTLDGYTMLGVGVELKPKKFIFSIMHGRLNRATTVDTTLGTIQPFSFSRKGTAIKLGIGNEKNFFILSGLKAKDDSSSVDVSGSIKEKVRPAENLVGSAAFRKQIAKIFFIEGDAAGSIYTNDMGSPLAFTDSVGIIDAVSKIIKINGTTEFSTAYSAGAGVQLKNFSVKFEYKNVSPNFKSMGVYYFNTDAESFMISPSFNIGSKFSFSGSVGKQRDNTKNQKEATTTRWITTGAFNWNITNKFGIDANFSNFSTNSKPVVVLVQNKYLLAQNNNNLSITPRFITSNTKGSHVVILSYNQAVLSDRNNITQTQNDINTNIILLSYTYTFFKQALSITTAINKTTNKMSVGTFNNTGFSLAANKSFLKNKITTSVSTSFTNSKGITNSDANIFNAALNGSYQPAKHHRLNLRIALLNNTPTSGSTQIKYGETTGEFGYTYSF
ncbi:MAG: hypothetical protein LC134_02645 [Chitinophagales bacterium]|nr:hypothetical protein [Chitinophagales bacterium]